MGRLVSAVAYGLSPEVPPVRFQSARAVVLPNLQMRFFRGLDANLLKKLDAKEIASDQVATIDPVEYAVAASDVPQTNWGSLLMRSAIPAAVDGEGVVVAVLDSGVSGIHPMLAHNVLPQKVEADDDGDLTVADNTPPVDSWWHGTHVASIIAGPDGVAPAAKILSVKVLQKRFGTAQSVCRGIDYILSRDDVSVVCMSFEMGRNDEVAFAVSKLVESGRLVVAAAGNHGVGSTPLPAACLQVVSVGAMDEDRTIWENSASGIVQWNGVVQRLPTVVAPGYLIVGANAEDGGTKLATGTSQAAPAVAGLAALMRQGNPLLTQAEFAARLCQAAEDILPKGLDDRSGYGLARYA